MERPDLARRMLMEAIGAFALVVAGCGAIIADTTRDGALGTVGISLVFGLSSWSWSTRVGTSRGRTTTRR